MHYTLYSVDRQVFIYLKSHTYEIDRRKIEVSILSQFI